MSLPSYLPALYQTFVIEARHGFNKSTLGLWIADKLKEQLLFAALGLPLLAGFLKIMNWAGDSFVGYLMLFLCVNGDTRDHQPKLTPWSPPSSASPFNSSLLLSSRPSFSRSSTSSLLCQPVLFGPRLRHWRPSSAFHLRTCTRSTDPSAARIRTRASSLPTASISKLLADLPFLHPPATSLASPGASGLSSTTR